MKHKRKIENYVDHFQWDVHDLNIYVRGTFEVELLVKPKTIIDSNHLTTPYIYFKKYFKKV